MKPKDLGLPKSARLRRSREFKHVFDGAKKLSDHSFLILYKSNGGKGARLGLAISRKCAARSIDRNRIKRLVREFFRLSRHSMLDIDVVILCRRGAVTRTNKDLTASLRTHFDKLFSRS